MIGAVLGATGAILREYLPDERFGGFRIYNVFFLAALTVALWIPASFFNYLVFSALSCCICSAKSRTFYFYVLSFDGPLAAIVTIAFAWGLSRVILDTTGEFAQPSAIRNMDRTFGSLLALSILYGLRSLLLKVALSGVLKEAYEGRMTRLVHIQDLVKILTDPKAECTVDGAPQSPRLADEARTRQAPAAPVGYFQLAGSPTTQSPKQERVISTVSDFHSIMRRMERGHLKMYDGKGRFRSVRKPEKVIAIAKRAFLHLVDAAKKEEEAQFPVPPRFQLRPLPAATTAAGAAPPPATPPLPPTSPPLEVKGARSVPRLALDRQVSAGAGGGGGGGGGEVGAGGRRPTGATRAELELSRTPDGPAWLGHRLPHSRTGLSDTGASTGLQLGGVSLRVETPKRRHSFSNTQDAQDAARAAQAPPEGEQAGRSLRGMNATWKWARDLLGFHSQQGELHRDAEGRTVFITRKQFQGFIGNDDNLLPLYNIFDRDEDGFISSVEFEAGLLNCYEEWKGFRAALANHGYVSKAVRALADLIYGLIGIIVVLWIFSISVAELFLPITSVLLSLSFAFGGVLSNIVTSFVFVAFTRPYDVGERVSSSALNGNETLIVAAVDVLSTTFDRLNGKKLIMPNWVLAQMPIENHRRAQVTFLMITVSVGRETSATQLTELKDRLKSYISSQPQHWKEGVYFIVVDEHTTNQGLVTVQIWVQCRHRWQDGAKVWRARSAFMTSMFTSMRELHIRCQQAPLPVLANVTDHRRMHDFVSDVAGEDGGLRHRHPAEDAAGTEQ